MAMFQAGAVVLSILENFSLHFQKTWTTGKHQANQKLQVTPTAIFSEGEQHRMNCQSASITHVF